MDIKQTTLSIKKQMRDFMRKHPKISAEDSIPFVVKNLEEKHVAAMEWMEIKYNTAIDAHNLHDCIVNYEQMQSMAKLAADADVSDFLQLQPGKFNPAHLIAYFNR